MLGKLFGRGDDSSTTSELNPLAAAGALSSPGALSPDRHVAQADSYRPMGVAAARTRRASRLAAANRAHAAAHGGSPSLSSPGMSSVSSAGTTPRSPATPRSGGRGRGRGRGRSSSSSGKRKSVARPPPGPPPPDVLEAYRKKQGVKPPSPPPRKPRAQAGAGAGNAGGGAAVATPSPPRPYAAAQQNGDESAHGGAADDIESPSAMLAAAAAAASAGALAGNGGSSPPHKSGSRPSPVKTELVPVAVRNSPTADSPTLPLKPTTTRIQALENKLASMTSPRVSSTAAVNPLMAASNGSPTKAKASPRRGTQDSVATMGGRASIVSTWSAASTVSVSVAPPVSGKPTPPSVGAAVKVSCDMYGNARAPYRAAETCAMESRKKDQIRAGGKFEGFVQRAEMGRRLQHEWRTRWMVVSGCVLAFFDDDRMGTLVDVVLLGDDAKGERDAHVIHGSACEAHFDRRFVVGIITHPRDVDVMMRKSASSSVGSRASAVPSGEVRGAALQLSTEIPGPGGSLTHPGTVRAVYVQCVDEVDTLEWVAVLRAQIHLARQDASTSLGAVNGMVAKHMIDASGKLLIDPQRYTLAGNVEKPLAEYGIVDGDEGALGEGSFGTVFLATHTGTGERVAIKTMPKPKPSDERMCKVLRSELACMERLRHAGAHPSVVGLVDIVEDEKNVHVVMEVAEGSELRQYIEQHALSEQERKDSEAAAAGGGAAAAAGGTAAKPARKRKKKPPAIGIGMSASKLVAYDVAAAIMHMHKCGTVHRDLKPENVQRDEFGRCKVLDFGFGRVLPADVDFKLRDTADVSAAQSSKAQTLGLGFMKDSASGGDEALLALPAMGAATGVDVEWDSATGEPLMRTMFGTKYAAAPEIWRKEPYTRAVDGWGVGVILYMSCVGVEPFSDFGGAAEQANRIMRGEFQKPEPAWSAVDDGAKDLIARCLAPDAAKRAMPEDILAHPWLANVKPRGIVRRASSTEISRYKDRVSRRKLPGVQRTLQRSMSLRIDSVPRNLGGLAPPEGRKRSMSIEAPM